MDSNYERRELLLHSFSKWFCFGCTVVVLAVAAIVIALGMGTH